MSYIQPIKRELDIGAVFSDTFKALAGDMPGWALFALLLVLGPNLAVVWWLFEISESATADVASLFITLTGVILGSLFQVLGFRVAARRLNGETAGFAGELRAGVGRYLPFLAVVIVQGLGVLLGAILLIVPGIYLMLVWAVAGPVIAVEAGRLDNAFRRSADLTRGSRWRILGLVVLASIIIGVLGALSGMLSAAAFAFDMQGREAALVQTVLDSLSTVVVTAGTAALYFNLVEVREGGSRSALAEVFG